MSGWQGAKSEDRTHARVARDAAISRVGRTRRWLIVGAAALTAGLAALTSALNPGRSLAAKAPSTVASTGHPTASGSAAGQPLPPEASPSALGLQGPNQAPQSSPDPSQVSPDPSQVAPDPSQVAPDQQAQAAPGPVVSGGS